MKKGGGVKKRGFTLIELIVVVAIIGILATIVVLNLSSARAKAKDTKRIADLKQLKTAMELYNNAKGSYPAEAASYDASWSRLATDLQDYVTPLPQDPSFDSNSPQSYFYNYAKIDGSWTSWPSCYGYYAIYAMPTDNTVSSKECTDDGAAPINVKVGKY